jgi:gallate dioxygenase
MSARAEIVAGFGVSHSPHAPEEVRKTGADHPLLPLYARVSEAVEAVKPDVLIIFDCDHFSTFFLDNWPIFAIGLADRMAGPNDMTVMPRYELKGHPALAAHIHRHCVASGFDLALLQDFEVDHSIVVPLHFIPPTQSIPIIPIFINGFVPPLPSSRRCHALGRSVRAAVESFPQPLRVGIMASGQFSLEIGGPKVAPGRRQGVPDPKWGERVTQLLAAGENATLVAEATFPRLQKAGNIGGELLNWIALLGAIDDRKATWVASQYSHGDGFAVWQWS